MEIYFDETTTDADLITLTDTWIDDSSPYHDEMIKHQNRMAQYYAGNQTGRYEIPEFDSNATYNRIFEATETIVPIVVSGAHRFIAIPSDDTEESKDRAKKLQHALERAYTDTNMRSKLEVIVRHMILMRFGVMKWGWDADKDNVDVWEIDPRLIFIPKLRSHPRELPYVIELQEYVREDFETYFPDTNFEDYQNSNPKIGDKKNQSAAQVLEISTPYYKVWRAGSDIIKRMKNPYFDFDGEKDVIKETTHSGRIKQKEYQRYRNHLSYPVVNYVFFAPFRIGDTPISPTCLAEIAEPIQDDINVQKRLITDNLNRMGNGQIFADSEAVTQEEAETITNQPGLVIRGKGIVSENRIRREPGLPLPATHFSNLQDSIVSFDNIFGTHGAVRGAGNSETLGGQILNRQQDISRIDQLTAVVNQGVAELADGLVQCFKMFYDKEHVFHIIGAEGSPELIRFSRDDIDDNAVIETKSGNPVSLDPLGKYNQAIQLWQLQAIDPETLYERLDFANPQISSQKLAAWRAGQLMLEASIKGSTEKPGVEGAPADVETPNDATQRATEVAAGAGMGKAPLSNTPNQ